MVSQKGRKMANGKDIFDNENLIEGIKNSQNNTFSGNGPLASLYNNKYREAFLQFPANIEAAEENHWVAFYITEFLGAPLRKDESRDLLTQSNNKSKSFLGRIVENTAEKGGIVLNAAKRIPGGIVKSTVNEVLNDLPPGVANFGKDFLQKNKNKTKGLGTIILYAPHVRQDSFKTNWQNQATHQAGAALKASGSNIGQLAKDTINNNNETLKSFQLNWKTLLEGAAAKIAGSMVGNETLDDIAFRRSGVAYNNHLEMFFQSVDFRTYNFEFKLAPKNSHEARTIRDIIQLFKYASAPALVDGESGIFFAYPNVFEIEFFNEKQTHKISRSVLTSITVDHSASGVNSTFYDDYPIETNLNLTFTELEIMHKEKIESGY